MKRLLIILLVIFCVTANQSVFAAYPTTTEHHKLYPYTSIMASPYSGDPTGVLNCAAAIESIKANQSNLGTIYIPRGTFRIGTNLTIPAGMTLVFAAGAYFTIDAGVTLTLPGPVVAPDGQSCFIGAGVLSLGTTFTSSNITKILQPGTWAVTTNTTIPANITLRPRNGAVFAISAGVTLTINGYLEAGLYQIFSGDGIVNLGLGSVEEVYSEWWGAVADNVTDCRTAIRAAIQCLETRGGGTIKFAARGNYVVSNGSTPGDPGIWVEGYDASGHINIEGNQATINGATCNGPIVRLGKSASSGAGTEYLCYVVIRDLNIAGVGSSAANLAAFPYQDGLYIGNSQKISVQDVLVINIARNGIVGKKNTTGSAYRVWSANDFTNVKISNCGNAGICLGQNNHDDADLQVIDDVAMFNVVASGLGKAYSTPDTGYESTQAGVIILGYGIVMNRTEFASVYCTDASHADKVTSGRFAAAGWTYGAGWAQDATNYEADATAADGNLTQDLADMENTTYTVAFAVRNYVGGSVTPYIGAAAGTLVNANGGYCQTITTGATGVLTLKFDAIAFTGSITDVRVMKYPRGLNTGVFIRYARGLSINGIHYETIGSNQPNSRDLCLEDCTGTVNGYHTFVSGSTHARCGIYLTNSGIAINGVHQNNILGYALNYLVYFAGTTNNSLVLGLTKATATPQSPKPHSAWVTGDTGPSVFGNIGIFPESGGAYSGNLKLAYNDRYPSMLWRSATTNMVGLYTDVLNGDFFFDVTRKLYFRDITAAVKMTLDLSKGVLNLAALTAAPSLPTTNDIACADRTNWDPLAKGSGGSYLVRYNGAAWVAIDAQ